MVFKDVNTTHDVRSDVNNPNINGKNYLSARCRKHILAYQTGPGFLSCSLLGCEIYSYYNIISCSKQLKKHLTCSVLIYKRA